MSIETSFAQHRLRKDEAENPYASAYKETVDAFATSQLRLLRADHLSSHRDGGVPARSFRGEGRRAAAACGAAFASSGGPMSNKMFSSAMRAF